VLGPIVRCLSFVVQCWGALLSVLLAPCPSDMAVYRDAITVFSSAAFPG
jgi:hypothetical protein